MKKATTPFSAFEKLTRALTAVPKTEIDAKAKEYAKRRKPKRRKARRA